MEHNLDQSIVAKRSGQNRPTEEHEAMARALLGAMQKMMQESSTTTGEVVGDDGGKVRVRFADADEPREIGFPRVRGQRYQKGDRVPLHRLRGGDWFLGGALSTKEGLDPAVANDDIHTEAVDRRALHGSVRNDIDGARQRAEQGINDASHAQGDANEARRRADNAQNKADSADNKAGNAQSDANTAKNKADAAQADVNSVKNKLDGKAIDVSVSGKDSAGKTITLKGTIHLPSL